MHVLRLIHVPPFRQFGKHRAAKGEREKKGKNVSPHLPQLIFMQVLYLGRIGI